MQSGRESRALFVSTGSSKQGEQPVLDTSRRRVKLDEPQADFETRGYRLAFRLNVDLGLGLLRKASQRGT